MSWLVRGAFIIMLFGAVTGGLFLATFLTSVSLPSPVYLLLLISASLASIYTAFLLAQAKGRDFWQSPLLPFEKLALSTALGSGTLLSLSLFLPLPTTEFSFLENAFFVSLGIVLLYTLMELYVTQATRDAFFVAR